MKKLNKLKLYSLAAFAALIFVSNARAQQTAAPTPPPTAETQATQGSFRNKILEVRHRDPNNLLPVLRALGSGVVGSTISASREFKTLTVRDFPENIATIEQAVKRLDVPETPQIGIELRIHVLVASNAPEASNDYPADLKETVGQLQSTLNFKNYRLVNSLIQRTREGASVNGSGVADFTAPASGNNPASGAYNFIARSISLDSSARTTVVQIGEFNFKASFYVPDRQIYQDANINTSVAVRDGERVVVGTASLKDKALILVLTARVIK
ncbi:MAG: hypothetical protein H0V27_15410 [Pyrinomonadaceae bacterium]|nr:hypothetical protein [Pyrinomonadaceae bacterium]